jgi:small nuclear ribonucleoprotein E
MNLVIDDAVEVKQATKIAEESRRTLGALITNPGLLKYANNSPGQILLKGDNVSLIQSLSG